MNTADTKVSKGKKLAWTAGLVSGGLLYLVMTHLTYALTKSVGMSAIVVGNIFLFSRVFDGFTDFIAGHIIDKTHSKWGKARIYDLMYIPAWVFVVLCFSVQSSWSSIAQIIFLVLVYNLNNSIFYTVAGCAETVRLKRCFAQEQIVDITAVTGVISALVNAVGSLAIPVLISAFQDRPFGWSIIALVFAIPCCLLTLVRFFFVPEIYTSIDEEKKNKTDVTLIESIKLVFTNKYAIILFIVLIVYTIVQNTGIGDYYFEYVFGDVAFSSVAGIISLVGIVFLVFLPKLVEKFQMKNTVIFCSLLAMSGCLMRYFMPTNIVWCGITSMINIIGLLPFSYLRAPLLIDCMDYGQYKSGKNLEGIYSALLSIVNKIGLGLGPVLLGFCLEISGFDGALEQQSESAVSMIKFLMNGIPAIGMGVMAVLMCFYNIEKQMPAIREELEKQGKLVEREL